MCGPYRHLARQAIRTRVHGVVFDPLEVGAASKKDEKEEEEYRSATPNFVGNIMS